MEPITFQNIHIDGVEFDKLLNVEISHSINEHGAAVVKGEMATENARNFVNRIDEKTGITISTTANGQPKLLFAGVINNAEVEKNSDFSIVILSLISSSISMDLAKCNKR